MTNRSSELSKRSVDNLQRLYSIVISLAVAMILVKGIAEPYENGGKIFSDGPLILRIISFICIVIPFYHGANCYLDSAYVTNGNQTKRFALLVDFCALFFQAIIFFIAALLVTTEDAFYNAIAIILGLDIIWVISTYFTQARNQKRQVSRWAIINAITIAVVLYSVWSTSWKGEMVRNIFLTLAMLARTIIDYWVMWPFYYPEVNNVVGGASD